MPPTPCTYPVDSCPIDATAYGYIPNFPSAVFFDTAFGLLLVTHIFILAFSPRSQDRPHRRHYIYSTFALLGTIFSFLGFLSRIWLDSDVWNRPALAVEMITNLLAPDMALGILGIVVPRAMEHLRDGKSWLSGGVFAWTFHSANAASIIMFIVGGGVAIAQGVGRDTSDGAIGGRVILAGIILQLLIILALGGLVARFAFRFRRQKHQESITSLKDRKQGQDVLRDVTSTQLDLSSALERPRSHLRPFIACMILAYVCVFLHCVYRLVQFADGWGNAVMRNEPAFLVFEGATMFLVWIALTVAHPAFLFPPMGN